MGSAAGSPETKPGRRFLVEIRYECPYPVRYAAGIIEARTHERAAVMAVRALKRSRPRKRTPAVLNVRIERL